MSAGTRPRTPARPEIQALRALAVGMVVLYHFWPRLAPAGFVGVDVFFVVSGFLITGMLLREATTTGRIDLRAFYARRIRRILPAATLVLLFTAVMTILFAPQRSWPQYLDETLASLLYVQNWDQALDSQQPGQEELPSSPVQHFWSLSIEEQFYLVWPLLLLLGLWLASRRRLDRRRTVVTVLAVASLASFACNVSLTFTDNNLAYFSTFARAWEFGVGGLLAAVRPVDATRLVRVRVAASWAGIAAIVAAALTLREEEIFPGWVVLLPVAGTLAIIWAGTPVGRLSTAGLAKLPPVQWLGDISYSLYLWHWPIVMFTPYVTGRPSETPVMVLLLAISITAAWATTTFVENPIRFGTAHHRRPRLPLLATALGVTTALILAAVVSGNVGREAGDRACESSSRTSYR